MSDAIQRWDTEIARLVAKGMTKAEAYKSLSKSDPALRRSYVEAYNATYNTRAAY
jgi:hypothetical protein